MTTHHNFLERDIITVNFDPSVGTEIKKRRPAIVISKNGYNKGHSFFQLLILVLALFLSSCQF